MQDNMLRCLVFRQYNAAGFPIIGGAVREVEVEISEIGETSESYRSEGYELEAVMLPSELQ